MCLCCNLQQGDNSIYTTQKKLYSTQIMATSIQFGASKRLTYAPKPEQAYSTTPTSIYQKGQKMNKKK